MNFSVKYAITMLLAITVFPLFANTNEMVLSGQWTHRIRGGAVGEVTAIGQLLMVRRDNAAGEVLALYSDKLPVLPNKRYQLSFEAAGSANSEIRLLVSVDGREKRSWPQKNYILGTQTETICFEFDILENETAGLSFAIIKPGTYRISGIRIRELDPVMPKQALAENVLAGKWESRVRYGAVGKVAFSANRLVMRRENTAGEVLALLSEKIPVRPGMRYRICFDVTGAPDGSLQLLIPVSGGEKRPWPQQVFATAEQRRTITFDFETAPKENELGVSFIARKPGEYLIEAVKLQELSPLPAAIAPKENLLAGKWESRVRYGAIGSVAITPDCLTLTRHNNTGESLAFLAAPVSVLPNQRYRISFTVSGPSDGLFQIQTPTFGGEKRPYPTRSLATNGRREELYADFDTRENESGIGLNFSVGKPGTYIFENIQLRELDIKAEAYKMQARFRLVYKSDFKNATDISEFADSDHSRSLELIRVPGCELRFSGVLAILLKHALPLTTLKFESGFKPDHGIRTELVAYDVKWHELLRVDLNRTGFTDVTVPEAAAYTYLIQSTLSETAPLRDFIIRSRGDAIGSFRWRHWNSYIVGNLNNVPSRYRTEFHLSKLPVNAVGRFHTTGNIDVNGVDLGKGITGDVDQYYRNLLPALKVGENRIELKIDDPKAQSFLVDILISFADGTHKVILGDDGTWEFCETGKDQWITVQPLPSTYKPDCFEKRWISPAEMPEDFTIPVQFTGHARFAATKLNAIKRLPTELELNLQNRLFLSSNRLDLYIIDQDGTRQWKQALFGEDQVNFMLGAKGKICLKFDLCSEFLKPGQYKLELPSFLHGSVSGSFTIDAPCELKPDFALDCEPFSPVFRFNGKTRPASIFYARNRFNASRARYFLQDYCYVISRDADVHVYNACGDFGPDVNKNLGVNIGDLWLGSEQYAFHILDQVVENILSADPEARIILTIGLDSPQWWLKANPSERAVWHDGTPSHGVSWASQKWEKDVTETIRAMMRHYAAKPYATRIIGFYAIGGYDGQWWHYLDWKKFPFRLTDYNPAMTLKFRSYLRRIYNNDPDALRRAWHSPAITFDTAEIPTYQQRLGTTYYLDPQRGERHVTDYVNAQADVLKNHLDAILAAAKSLNPNLMAGSYYIPHWECSYIFGQAQRQLSDKIFDSPNYNFAAAPMTYLNRTTDKTGLTAFGRRQAFRLNGKLEVVEDDSRTFYGLDFMPIAMWGNYTPIECVQTGRRNYAQRLSVGVGQWYYDLYGHWLNNPVLTRIIREEQILRNVAAEFPELETLNARLALVSDVNVFAHRRLTTGADLGLVHYRRRDECHPWPVDEVLIRDLGHARLPKYRLYLIDDICALDAGARSKIEALKTDGNVLVFQHAAGYSDWNGLSPKNIGALCSMDIIESVPGKDLSDMSWDYATGNHPLLKNLPSGAPALRGFEAKRFAVKDSEAIPLGFYTDGGEVAAAIKTHEKYTAVYLPTTLPPPELLKNLATLAGVHEYTDAPVSIRSGGRFISIYCYQSHTDGKLRLPESYALYEVFSGKILTPTTTIGFSLQRGDTLLYFIGTPLEVKQFAEKVQKEW